MRENASKLSQSLCRSAIAIVAIGVAAAGPAVNATPNSNKAADKPINVVAHVQLPAGLVTQMLLVKKNGREYLLLGLGSSTSVAVLDVSHPSQRLP